jgi:hypothetical protein
VLSGVNKAALDVFIGDHTGSALTE